MDSWIVDWSRNERLPFYTRRRRPAADWAGGIDEALGTLDIALASTSLSVPARERTKATCVAVVNEVRMAVRELGRRGVERGPYSAPEDVMMLMNDELDAYAADPESFRDLIATRPGCRCSSSPARSWSTSVP